MKLKEIIEILDSDNEQQMANAQVSIVTTPSAAFVSKDSKPEIEAERVGLVLTKGTVQASDSTSSSPLMALETDQSVRDLSGKYILSWKVKVDIVEHLSEVPKRWPVPPEDKTVAYVVDLNNDARWNEWSSNNNKNIDTYLKQEVRFSESPFMKL